MDRIPTGRSSTSPDHHHLPAVDNANPNSASLAFHSIRNRFLVKRNPNSLPLPPTSTTAKSSSSASSSSHPPWRDGGAACGTRSHHHGGGRSAARKLLMFPFRGCGRSMFYLCIFVAVCAFALAYMVLQSSVASMMYRQVTGSSSSERQGEDREDLKLVPGRMIPQGEFEHDWLRNQSRIGIGSPRLGLLEGTWEHLSSGTYSESLLILTPEGFSWEHPQLPNGAFSFSYLLNTASKSSSDSQSN